MTPAPSGIIGYKGEGTSKDNISDEKGSYINLSRFKADADMTLSQLNVKLAESDAKYKLAIYSDANGNVGSLMGQTMEISKPPRDGWHSASLVTPQTVKAGTYYWLAVWSNSKSKKATVYDDATEGTLKWTKALTYADFPTTVVLDGGSNYRYCIYGN